MDFPELFLEAPNRRENSSFFQQQINSLWPILRIGVDFFIPDPQHSRPHLDPILLPSCSTAALSE